MIDLYSKLPIGEGVALLEKIYETMSSIVRSKSYLKIDLISNYSEFSFSTQIQEKFERFANFIALSTESTNKTHLDYYSEAFLEKYGLEREVKLVELLDPCIGLGAPFGYNHPSNDFIMEEPPFEFYSEAEEQMYLDLYTKAVSERRPIELSSIVNHYEKINSEKLSNIDGFDLFFNMVKKDGKTIFSLSNIIGSNTLGGGSGRFAGLSGTLQNFHEKLLQHEDRIGDLDNISTCEILFLPENLRHRNIMNTVSNRNFCLPISTDVSGK
ncbi:TPA: lantibiotic dehydratase, partial [Streptococcus suis]